VETWWVCGEYFVGGRDIVQSYEDKVLVKLFSPSLTNTARTSPGAAVAYLIAASVNGMGAFFFFDRRLED